MSAMREELSQTGSNAESSLPARPAARRMGRGLAIVVALLVVVVLAGGWLVDNVGTATPTQSELTQHVGLDTVSVTVSMAPQSASGGAPQTAALIVRVTDVTGAAVVGAQAQCALSMPGMAMSLAPVTATPTGQPGVYRCPAQELSSGAWALGLTLTLPSGETDHATFSFVVA